MLVLQGSSSGATPLNMGVRTLVLLSSNLCKARVGRYSVYMTTIQEALRCFQSDRIDKQLCLTEVLKSSYRDHVGL